MAGGPQTVLKTAGAVSRVVHNRSRTFGRELKNSKEVRQRPHLSILLAVYLAVGSRTAHGTTPRGPVGLSGCKTLSLSPMPSLKSSAIFA
jgi:hypothetical protein